ncbi:chitinase [Actinomadura fibrosa]|uniref:Chitinase n=1 Tax=Actinomadura fibrosa TaxID=111802 RepID=A0ABW2Y530_9ACTN|nr:chitinase [Actinomadura fibrosa]
MNRPPARPALHYLAAFLTAVLGTVACGLAVMSSSTVPSVRTVPAADTTRSFVPYVDANLRFDLVGAAKTTGVKTYTLAFVTAGGGCTPTWGGTTPLGESPVANATSSLRALGGDVRVSFGGASGTELATACSSTDSLLAAYDKVVTAFDLTRADFDIEGAALTDTAAGTRRAKAIAALQKKHPALKVSLTLPVTPQGLTKESVHAIEDATANGVAIDAVNIMAMDYGPPSTEMGDLAVQAATATETRLRSVLGVPSAWSRLAVTPMIGVNDVAGEIFTLADAARLTAFAADKDLAWTAMWSATRDAPCPGVSSASPTCSGLAHEPFAFTKAFAG